MDVGSTLNGVNGGGVGTYSPTLDGNSGGFRFLDINPTTYFGVSGWTGDVGPLLALGAANPTGSFTTGFLLASTPFVSFTFGNGINMDIDANNNLTFSSLDFGGNFQTGGSGVDFFLSPDPGTFKVNWVIDNEPLHLVSFQWSHLITTADDATGQFVGFNTSWIIEGVSGIPIPAAAWLFGSGLLGLVGIARRKAA